MMSRGRLHHLDDERTACERAGNTLISVGVVVTGAYSAYTCSSGRYGPSLAKRQRQEGWPGSRTYFTCGLSRFTAGRNWQMFRTLSLGP